MRNGLVEAARSAEWNEYIAKIKGKNRRFVGLKWKTHILKFTSTMNPYCREMI